MNRMKTSTRIRLDTYVAEHAEVLLRGPGAVEDIELAEATIGITFDATYREFLEHYGGGIIGSLPVYGVTRSEAMGTDDFVASVTAHYRNDGWPHTDTWAVISSDLGGSPIGLDEHGEIWLWDHDLGDLILLAPTFEAWRVQRLDEANVA